MLTALDCMVVLSKQRPGCPDQVQDTCILMNAHECLICVVQVIMQPSAHISRQPSPRPSGRRPRQIDALPAHSPFGNATVVPMDEMPAHMPSAGEQRSEQTVMAPVVIDHNMLQRRREFEALMLSWMRECEAAEDHPLLADALFDANALLQDLQGDAALTVNH